MFALKTMRMRAGLTQEQAGQAIGKSKSAYIKLEHEDRMIGLDDAVALADAFGCTLDELAGRTPPTSIALDADEHALIDAYRSTDARGRATIVAVARSQRGDAIVRSARSA